MKSPEKIYTEESLNLTGEYYRAQFPLDVKILGRIVFRETKGKQKVSWKDLFLAEKGALWRLAFMARMGDARGENTLDDKSWEFLGRIMPDGIPESESEEEEQSKEYELYTRSLQGTGLIPKGEHEKAYLERIHRASKK